MTPQDILGIMPLILLYLAGGGLTIFIRNTVMAHPNCVNSRQYTTDGLATFYIFWLWFGYILYIVPIYITLLTGGKEDRYK